MCWVAMDRATKLAGDRGDAERQATWRATAEEIKDRHPDARADQGWRACASTTTRMRWTPQNLLAALFGFLPGSDERLRASVLAIADDLTEDGFVLRYRTGETDDGMSGKEGSFLICSFWLVSGLAIIGEQQRARDLMEKAPAGCLPARAVCGGVRHEHGALSGQRPTGLLSPSADRGRRANHYRGEDGRVFMSDGRRA